MGWFPVCDQKPGRDGKWEPVKLPMRGVRYLAIDDEEGYLAVRYDKARYVFEGVPKRVFDVIRRHRGASIYFRQVVKDKYPCVDVQIYETFEAYQLDEGPVKEKLDAMMRQRIENATLSVPMQTDLFGKAILGNPAKRRGGRSRSSSSGGTHERT